VSSLLGPEDTAFDSVAGLSANEVARRAGVAPSTLSRARHRDAGVSSLVSVAVLSVTP
jgi:hypothetical protein